MEYIMDEGHSSPIMPRYLESVLVVCGAFRAVKATPTSEGQGAQLRCLTSPSVTASPVYCHTKILAGHNMD